MHIPFCRRRCDYCAFATYTDRDHLMIRYANACRVEIVRAREAGDLEPVSSVFFGGGTPSRLPAVELARILAEIPLQPGAEVTAECNPEDADLRRLTTYLAAGVTRISFGVQSTVPHVLRSLGRSHDPRQVGRAALLAAEVGFATFNFDLIFGAADECDDDWRRSLDEVLALPVPPPHVSAYALTVEPGTPLAADARRHPDDDVQAGRYEMTERVLGDAGYTWEEVSNWARTGHGCRHNQLYWQQGNYLGIGSAAHSHHEGSRWWNIRSPDRYVQAIEQGSSPVAGQEVLTPGQRDFERLALSLRTPAGVPTWALPDLPELAALVTRVNDRAVLTVRGRLLANAVTSHLRMKVGAAGILQ
ncbi:MAG: radical SAM family heme chaperone HemW [Acidimicrobiales bacterium]